VVHSIEGNRATIVAVAAFAAEDPILRVAMCFIVGNGAATWTEIGPVRWTFLVGYDPVPRVALRFIS
jgi:hypothetical protein